MLRLFRIALAIYFSVFEFAHSNSDTFEKHNYVQIGLAIPVGMRDFSGKEAWIPHLIEHIFVRKLIEHCNRINCSGSFQAVTEDNFTLYSIKVEETYFSKILSKLNEILVSELDFNVADIQNELATIEIEISNKISPSTKFSLFHAEDHHQTCDLSKTENLCRLGEKRKLTPKKGLSSDEMQLSLKSIWKNKYLTSESLIVYKRQEIRDWVSLRISNNHIKESQAAKLNLSPTALFSTKNTYSFSFPLQNFSTFETYRIQKSLNKYLLKIEPNLRINQRTYLAEGLGCYTGRHSSCLTFSLEFDGSEDGLREARLKTHQIIKNISPEIIKRLLWNNSTSKFRKKKDEHHNIRSIIFSEKEPNKKSIYLAIQSFYNVLSSYSGLEHIELNSKSKLLDQWNINYKKGHSIPLKNKLQKIPKNLKNKSDKSHKPQENTYNKYGSIFIPLIKVNTKKNSKLNAILTSYIKSQCINKNISGVQATNMGLLLLSKSTISAIPDCIKQIKPETINHSRLKLTFASSGINYDINTAPSQITSEILHYILKGTIESETELIAREYINKPDFGVNHNDYLQVKAYLSNLDLNLTNLKINSINSNPNKIETLIENIQASSTPNTYLCEKWIPNLENGQDNIWVFKNPNTSLPSTTVMSGFIASSDYWAWSKKEGAELKLNSLSKKLKASMDHRVYNINTFMASYPISDLFYITAETTKQDSLKIINYINTYLKKETPSLDECQNTLHCNKNGIKKYITYSEHNKADLKSQGINNSISFVDFIDAISPHKKISCATGI